MGKPTKVQNPHQPPHPKNDPPVKMFATAHAKDPTPKVQNGMMKVRVRIHARIRANPGKKKEMARATRIMMSSGMPLPYHEERELFTSSSELVREPGQTPRFRREPRGSLPRSLVLSLHQCILEAKIESAWSRFTFLVVILEFGRNEGATSAVT